MATLPQLALRGKRRLWIVMFVGSFVFMAVPLLVMVPPRAASPDPSVLWELAATGIAMAVASFVAPPWLARRALRTLPPLEEGENTAKDAMRRRMIAIQTFVLSVGLSEGVAFHGVAARVVGFSMTTALPFFAVGTVLMLLRFPTERSLPPPV